MNPLNYIRDHTDPSLVISTVVASLVVGGVLLVMNKSGVSALKTLASASK